MDSEQQKALLDTLEKLSPTDQSAVSRFAGFLLSNASGFTLPSVDLPAKVDEPPAEIPEPEHIPAPEDERVIAALKRLSKTYHMLSKNKTLGMTSTLMTQHIMQRREASEVIAELERVFQEEYEALKQGGD
ncbi:hypothetical protein MNBD_GAMMA15-2402 [hydrothermal vent metagenome]|uniref:Crp/Fnr family transcriptional regulator n=1 Tax=hydrothermal vent metagenome TaxID=652676 RepID=A0A3B0Y6C8_9ZZZZ